MSGLAGAAPAGVMGGLRAYLQRIIPDDLRERAIAPDATLLEPEWMFAPALVLHHRGGASRQHAFEAAGIVTMNITASPDSPYPSGVSVRCSQ
jgi:hypothetical protein